MKHLAPAIKLFLFFTFVLGVAYPVLLTVLGGVFFGDLASGGILTRNGQPIGASLIGQKFVNEKYFWGRPSSIDFNPIPSGGSNLGPTSEALKKAMNDRADVIRKAHGLSANDPIPQELLFASSSGLDPEITPEAAYFQIDRVAKARGLSDKEKLKQLILANEHGADLGFIGNPRVNVLKLNLALDEATGIPTIPPPAPSPTPSPSGG